MMRETDKEGYTIEVMTKHGTATVVNPKRKVAEFGLTPASRSRVAALLSDDTPKDDFAEFEEIK